MLDVSMPLWQVAEFPVVPTATLSRQDSSALPAAAFGVPILVFAGVHLKPHLSMATHIDGVAVRVSHGNIKRSDNRAAKIGRMSRRPGVPIWADASSDPLVPARLEAWLESALRECSLLNGHRFGDVTVSASPVIWPRRSGSATCWPDDLIVPFVLSFGRSARPVGVL